MEATTAHGHGSQSGWAPHPKHAGCWGLRDPSCALTDDGGRLWLRVYTRCRPCSCCCCCCCCVSADAPAPAAGAAAVAVAVAVAVAAVVDLITACCFFTNGFWVFL